MDRRHFLSTSLMAVTAATATTAHSAGAPALPSPAPAPTVALSEARFRSLLGSSFQFTGSDWRGNLKLTDVVARASDARTEQFTAVFQPAGTVPPAPGVYKVRHPDVGRFDLRIDGRESDLRLATFALLRG